MVSIQLIVELLGLSVHLVKSCRMRLESCYMLVVHDMLQCQFGKFQNLNLSLFISVFNRDGEQTNGN